MTQKQDPFLDADETNAPTPIRWLGYTALLISVMWGGSGYLIYKGFEQAGDRGTFGDMFGAINALFSGLAFSVLIYTMILQRIELKLQREELRSTRAELAGQKEQMELQNNTMRSQRFETTFFNLLKLFSDSVKALEINTGRLLSDPSHGRACFQNVLLNRGLIPTARDSPTSDANELQEAIQWVADELANSFNGLLSQYNSILEQIVLFIDTSQLDDQEKQSYAAILQSVLSQDEKVLLFFFGLSTYGRVKIKPFIERYALLTNLHSNREEIPPYARGYYAPHAFGAGAPT